MELLGSPPALRLGGTPSSSRSYDEAIVLLDRTAAPHGRAGHDRTAPCAYPAGISLICLGRTRRAAKRATTALGALERSHPTSATIE